MKEKVTPPKKWTREEEQKLRRLRKKHSVPEVARILKRKLHSVTSKLHELGIRQICPKYWTPAEIAKLKKLYPTTLNRKLAKMFKTTERSVIAQAFKHRLLKNKEWWYNQVLASPGLFRKGMTPWSKGMRQKDMMSKESLKRVRATQFKKGHVPATIKTDGAISLRKNNFRNKHYYYIRLAKGKWIQYHQYLWKKAGRKIPKGHYVGFIDKNPLNCVLENLELVSRQEGMRRNSASVNLTDNYVAFTIASKMHPELIPVILEDKNLIEMKRQVLIHKRKLKVN